MPSYGDLTELRGQVTPAEANTGDGKVSVGAAGTTAEATTGCQPSLRDSDGRKRCAGGRCAASLKLSVRE